MFKVEKNTDGIILRVELPQGHTQGELIELADRELAGIEESLHGSKVFINGRLTTGMALLLGHRLAHICKAVYIYDPKEGQYFKAVWH